MNGPAFGDAEIARELSALTAWAREGDAIVRRFDRGGFDGSIAFVNAIAESANAANHHPDLAIEWNMVTVRLSSHDAHGLTDRDFSLARKIDDLAG